MSVPGAARSTVRTAGKIAGRRQRGDRDHVWQIVVAGIAGQQVVVGAVVARGGHKRDAGLALLADQILDPRGIPTD